jgi:5'-3' exonuclease
MGVRGLFTYCAPIKRPPNHPIQNARIGIDGYSLFFLFKEEKEAFTDYMKKLKHDVGEGEGQGEVCVALDKRAAKEKREVVEERKLQRTEARYEVSTITSFTQSREFIELDPAQRIILEKLLLQKEKAAWHVYKEYMEWFIGLMKELKIRVIYAKEEADTVLIQGNYDVVISSDSDLLILGAKILWIPAQKQGRVQHVEISQKEFIDYLGLQGEQLFELAYMAGCDVQPKSLMTVQEAVSRLKFYGGMAIIHKKHPEIISTQHMEEYAKLRRDVWTY